jgi:Fe-S oxidoreductase
VLHHTQLLDRLVRDKKLVPVSRSPDITYTTRAIWAAQQGLRGAPRTDQGGRRELTEMPRHADHPAAGPVARGWWKSIGKRINHERVDEALATRATTMPPRARSAV